MPIAGIGTEMIEMTTYIAEMRYSDVEANNIKYTTRVEANSVSVAFAIAMDKFFASHTMFEIKKVVIKVEQSSWETTGDIMRVAA